MESFDNSGGINLVCESRGWNPEPEVLWLDREGDTLIAEHTQIHRDTEGFNVKSRITVYDYSDLDRFYCRLQQKHLMMETDIIIDSKVFHAWKWIVGISVSAFLVVVGLILTAVICHKKEQKKKNYAEFTEKKKCEVDVTLDPDSAHPQLILSEDGKQVRHVDTPQDLPDSPQRFDCNCVVGQQSFSSGRFYYEVQVTGKTAWTLGVISENIDRKKKIKDGLWLLEMRNENEYRAFAGPSVPLTLREKLEVVGVFVDYEEGLVSFYDVKSSSRIYSFTGQSFTENLYPYFSPCNNRRGRNSAPLIITGVNE